MPRGSRSFEKSDFDPKWFPEKWDAAIVSKRGTKRSIIFPVVMRSFLSKSPKLYNRNKVGNEILDKKPRLIQRLTMTVVKDTVNF